MTLDARQAPGPCTVSTEVPGDAPHWAVFARLYEQTYPRVFSYVMRTVMNVSTAEDIVSETYLKALKSIHCLQGGEDRFMAWLYRIATNTMMDHFRKRRREGPMPSDESAVAALLTSEGAAENMTRLERFRRVHQAVSSLGDKYRIAVVLFYFEEKSLAESAAIMKCTVMTAKYRLFRARRQLGAILTREDFSDE